MVVHLTSWFGTSTGGTSTGPSGPSGQATRITEFSVWADANYVYAIQCKWSSTSVTYGDNSHGSKTTAILGSNEWICAIYCDVDGQSYFRGISFDSNLNAGVMTCGYFGDGITTIFNDSSFKWTDLIVYTKTVLSKTVIVGIRCYYTAPTFAGPEHLAFPALGVLAHTAVITKSFQRVGELRGKLQIKAPSCDPPQGTDPEKAQLWYRTFRAQENCKEMFLVYLPSIFIASTFGYEVFGKWATRAVGTLTLVSAFFRYKYLVAYIDNADKRGPPFYYSTLAMRPVFYLAVVSCGYIVGKQIYKRVQRQVGHGKNIENE